MDQREAGSVLSRYWPAAVSVVAFAAMALSWGRGLSGLMTVVLVALLIGAVLASVNHAHVVARRVGSVVGTLILALRREAGGSRTASTLPSGRRWRARG